MRRSILIGAVAVLSVIGFLGCGTKSEAKPKPKSESRDTPEPPPTISNLDMAYHEEVDAKARYEAFAAKANEEGYKSASALWRAAANSIGLSLVKHQTALKVLGVEAKAEAARPDVKSTKENLEATVKDKTAALAVLPACIKAAQREQLDKVAMSFMGRKAADEQYLKLFTEAAASPDGWKAGDKEFLVCQVCSYVSTDLTLKQCPICSAPREKFTSFK